MNTRRQEGWILTLLELLVVAAIISLLAYKGMKTYLVKPTLDKETNQAFVEQGIDTSSYRSVVSTTKDKLNGITAQRQRSLDTLGQDQ